MSSHASISPPARTWRDIPQTIAPRAMSSTGRKRMFFATAKSVAVLVLGCASLWAGYEIHSAWKSDPAKLKAAGKSAPVKTIALRGENLVLDQAWVARTLALPKSADLTGLDLFALRDRLIESGQVRTAVLTRKFPDTLVVSMEERSPVARVNARFGDGEPETFLVARDGVVFRGENYRDDVLQGLPFLGGVGLRRVAGKFVPIDGMETVADLLSTARMNAPELYRSWSVVSLEKLVTDGHILVQSADAGQVVFGTRDDFYRQIARLDFILDNARKDPAPLPLKSINLAVGGEQVPVAFELPAPAEPAAPGGNAHRARSGAAPGLAAAAPHSFTLRAAPTRPQQASNAQPQRSTLRRDF